MKNTGFIDITDEFLSHDGPYYDAKLTGKNASKDRKYIKTLQNCLDYSTMKEIYPNVSKPLSHELISLLKLGYLRKYTKPDCIKSRNWNGVLTIDYYSRVWYKITEKGLELLAEVSKK